MKEPLVLVPGAELQRRALCRQWPALSRWTPDPGRRSPPRRHAGRHREPSAGSAASGRVSRSAACRWAAMSRFEVLRQAPERVTRLALLDTSAKPATPRRLSARADDRAGAKGAFDNVTTLLWQQLVAPPVCRRALRCWSAMADEVGARGLHPAARGDHAAAGFAPGCWRPVDRRRWFSSARRMRSRPSPKRRRTPGLVGDRGAACDRSAVRPSLDAGSAEAVTRELSLGFGCVSAAGRRGRASRSRPRSNPWSTDRPACAWRQRG